MAVTFTKNDLQYLLTQIVMAETGTPPVSPHLAFGLREVSGTNNNSVPGQSSFGAADRQFSTATDQFFQTVTISTDGTIFDAHPGVAGDTMTTSYAQTAATGPASVVFDTAPRTISNLISDISANNPAALQTAQEFGAQLGDGYTVFSSNPAGLKLPGADGVFGTADDLWGIDGIAGTADDTAPPDLANLFIGNVTPDAGLSAPFNSWMTFFGQFFDHGLDLITKGNSGTVLIPLMADDPLIAGANGIFGDVDDLAMNLRFMPLTRATNVAVGAGGDAIVGTADDIHTLMNTTTPFVDQNQTYSSHPSHQVFLREYILGADGLLHTTGNLLQHAEGKDGLLGTLDDNSGMATWGDLKANALKLGIVLTDYNVGNVPLLLTDAYGNFIRGPLFGGAQVVTDSGPVEMNPNAPALLPATAHFTDHAFINDMAHFASPFSSTGILPQDGDAGIAGNIPEPGTYDNELLNAHYVAGDGRVNENIALTTVHEIFHDEHNRLIEQTKAMVRAELANGDTAFATDWVLAGTNLADGIQENEWNGERLFQVAKFGTETQYQHLVFEEFARKVAPTIHLFGNNNINLDPSIVSEFANAVYRFGHSMLDENVAIFEVYPDGTMQIGSDGQPILTPMGLIQAFTNPLAFANLGADGTQQIIQGSTHQIGSEIDEFVTGALRNNLLGLPLDLAALNIARGRDTGVAPLNLVRAQIYDATHDATMKPYANWLEFGQFLKHSASLINFVAAYGTHATIASALTLDDKRTAAVNLVTMGIDPLSATGDPAHIDAYNFMHSLGAYANDVPGPGADFIPHTSDDTFASALSVHAAWSTGSVTGVDNIDLWIGGLAEKQNLFGGLLGSTFNFIFETQLENLQDGDRLYYLPRIEGMDFGTQIENNSFADMIIANTGARHIPASIFLTPEYTIEAGSVTNDPSTWLKNPVTGAYLVEKLADGTVHFIGDDNFFGNTMVLGGTAGDDRLQAGHADDDTVWGDAGNDWIDGGNGNDFLYGGTGNDTIVDAGGDDVIHGEAGDDTINGGIGDDLIFGGDGNDYIETGYSILGDEAQGGAGNDIIIGGDGDDALFGNEGDDWLEGGAGGDSLVGDTGAPTGMVPLFAGNDVLDGGAFGDTMVGFSGDDIMLGEGGFDKFNGWLGFDWADFEKETHGVSVDMARREFIPNQQQPAGDAVRDFFVETEATSGSRFDDFIQGTEDSGLAAGTFNELTNVDLIFNLAGFFAAGPVNFSNGNILLGGDGSDTLTGRGGNDILDGDAWLHVALTSHSAGAEIIREIRFDITDGDIDTAVYRGNIADYNLTLTPDAQGFISISHNGTVGIGGGVFVSDGTDRLRNIERIQFADATISIDSSPTANAIPVGVPLVLGDTNPAVAGVDGIVGSPLTVSFSGVTDADGIVPNTTHFQWQQQLMTAGGGLSWIDIAGATNTSFAPSNLQLGNALRVVESFTDGQGWVERVNSAPTNPVAPNLLVNTAPFVVQQQGLVGLPDTNARTGFPINVFLPLTVTFGDRETASNLLTFTAKLDNGAALSTRGLTFTLVPDGLGGFSGANITGTVSATGPIGITITANDGGSGVFGAVPLSVTDTFIINVQAGDRAPVTAGPQTFGTNEDLAVNGTLLAGTDPDGDAMAFKLVQGSAVNGTVSINGATGAFAFTPSPNYASQDASLAHLPLGGPASFQYTLFDGLVNSSPQTVTIDVTAVDDGAAPVSITGTAAVGGTLSAVIGTDPDGPWNDATATYQWQRDGANIATGIDYTVTAADIGHHLSVVATYDDGQNFHTTAASDPTAPIGILAVQAVPGISNAATLVAFNSTVDPDGNPTPDGISYDWEVSTDSINWTPAPAAWVSPDSLNLTLPNNTTRYVRTTATYVDAAGNFGTILSEAVRVFAGQNGSQTFTGNAGVDIYFGLSGSDTINTGGGNDTIVGGTGNDNLNGGTGNDTFMYTIGDGADTINGGTGTDQVIVTGTNGGNTITVTSNGSGLITQFQGGNVTGIESFVADLLGGTDTLNFSNNSAANGVSVSLAAGNATGFALIAGIENVTGGAGSDTIFGDTNINVIVGGGGADVITGGAGDDQINGNGGNDRFIATILDGNDSYDGGNGTDTLDLSDITGSVNVNLGASLNLGGSIGTIGSNRAIGTQIGTDTLSSIENVIGGTGNDIFIAANAPETFSGGLGSDTFVYRSTAAAGNNGGRSVITDFTHGTDHIDLRFLDADSRGAAPGTQHFAFAGLAAPGAGQVGYHYFTDGSGGLHTIIDGNVRTGGLPDTTIDFQIDLLGHLTLDAGDFVFGP